MDDIRHGLYRRPWLSAAHSDSTRMLITSWETLASLGFLYFARGGEFYHFLYQCALKQFFF